MQYAIAEDKKENRTPKGAVFLSVNSTVIRED